MSKVAVDNPLKNLFKRFRVTHKDLIKKVDYNLFSSVLDKLYEVERETILNDGEYKLPYQLGVLEIVKNKVSTKYQSKLINYQETKRLNTKIINFNDHSDGYAYKIKWNKRTTKLYDKQTWIFKSGRTLSRSLAQVIKNKINDYPEAKR